MSGVDIGPSSMLEDLPELPDRPADVVLQGPPITPRQRLFLCTADEWEEFALEWAMALSGRYVQVKRLTGSGDRGVDVAGFVTEDGFEGEWDCFQCKHYDHALVPGDVIPEIVKVFRHALARDYKLPRSYRFLAPRGMGPKLNALLSTPSELQAAVLAATGVGSGAVIGLDFDQVSSLRDLMSESNFNFIGSVEVKEALEVHSQTRYHAARFGTALPPRSAPVLPPPSIGSDESIYVSKLIDAYNENDPARSVSLANVASTSTSAKHFKRQRVRFYCAESLRVYARDSVPVGTFEALQDDIHDGVIDVAESEHVNGLERLTRVISTAGALSLQRHALLSVVSTNDRAGICHQLANDDKLTWVAQP